MTESVTVMGLGPMGQALARTLLDRGLEVTVWNRTPERAVPLADQGAKVAPTPAAAVRAADIVLVSVRGNDVARSILEDADLSSTGPLVVNLSSDTPASARELAAWVRGQGAGYLGGTMLTPSMLVGRPGSTAMVGGDRGAFERARPTLELIAPELTHQGDDPGTVAALDLAVLDAFWTTVAGWSHAVALGRSEGLEADAVSERLTAIVRLAAEVGAGISRDAEDGVYPGDVSTIASARTSLTHILQASRDAALDESIPRAIEALFARAVDDGNAGDGPSRLVPTIAAMPARRHGLDPAAATAA